MRAPPATDTLRHAELSDLPPRIHIVAMPLSLPVYTADMLRDFPDDGNRYELLEGFLIVTPTPSRSHQVIAGRVFSAIERYLAPTGLAYAVPVGEITRAPRIVLQPDILVLSGTESITAPWTDARDWWLAVEVFSPSSRMYDRNYKRDAYLALGVREVWLLDLDEKEVLVSRPSGPTDSAVHDVLRWHPVEMPAPLEVDLSHLFRGLA